MTMRLITIVQVALTGMLSMLSRLQWKVPITRRTGPNLDMFR